MQKSSLIEQKGLLFSFWHIFELVYTLILFLPLTNYRSIFIV